MFKISKYICACAVLDLSGAALSSARATPPAGVTLDHSAVHRKADNKPAPHGGAGAGVPARHDEAKHVAVRPTPQAAADALGLSPAMLDPELATALAVVLERSPAVNAAKTDARAAGIDVSAARWRRLPTMSVQGNYYGVQGSAPRPLVPNISVDLPLWNAGRTHAIIQRAIAGRRAAEARLVEAELDAALQLVSQFYEYKRLSARLLTVTDNLAAMQAMEDSMQRRVTQEVSPRSDLELARTRTLQVRLIRDAIVAQRQAVLARLHEQLVDPDYQIDENGLVGPFWLKADLEDLIGAADAFDPHRQRLEAEADIAAADAKASNAARFPSVNAQYSYDDIYGHRLGVTVRAQVTGLAEFTEARAGTLREGAARQKVDIALHDLRSQVSSDYIDYTSSLGRLDVARSSSRSTNEVRDSYIRQFTAGKRGWLDVMNAMREAMTAQLDALDNNYAAAQAQTRLLIRAGMMPAEMKRLN